MIDYFFIVHELMLLIRYDRERGVECRTSEDDTK
jgi:hypothetical protein